MSKSPLVLLIFFAALLGLTVLAAGRWHPVHAVLAVMGGMCVGLVWLAAQPLRGGFHFGAGRLPGGPTARQVRARTAALFTEYPADRPAELAARVRAWYGGGAVKRTAGDLNSCVLLPVLLPMWLVRDALFAPTPEEFERSVSDAVAEVTGQPPPTGGWW